MNLKGFKYSNIQFNMHGGNKITHKVHIKNGKGYKSVTHFRHNKKVHHSKKHLSSSEIGLIKIGKFIPGLFKIFDEAVVNAIDHSVRTRKDSETNNNNIVKNIVIFYNCFVKNAIQTKLTTC